MHQVGHLPRVSQQRTCFKTNLTILNDSTNFQAGSHNPVPAEGTQGLHVTALTQVCTCASKLVK